LRAGYSALTPHGWIRAHCGSSNTRLKLHLGLIVPRLATSSLVTEYADADGTADLQNCTACANTEQSVAVLHQLPSSFWAHPLRYAPMEQAAWTPAIDTASCRGQCAFFRIGQGERRTRCWHAGEVLILDDSFEHEVINACDEERVVLQVVVEHPAITIANGDVGKPMTLRPVAYNV
jgi:hypothetical protein